MRAAQIEAETANAGIAPGLNFSFSIFMAKTLKQSGNGKLSADRVKISP
jgi:hypothetical protein